MITIWLCEYEDLWKVGARDGKTLAAWALYEGLSRAGVIEKRLRNCEARLLALPRMFTKVLWAGYKLPS
jgi:hypothetical protein